MKQPAVPITGIHLKRIGDHVIVAVEVEGRWVDVIKEFHEGPFSHIVEPAGIEAALRVAEHQGPST